jgi:hypothetical protein
MRSGFIIVLFCIVPAVAQQRGGGQPQRGMYGGVSTGQMVGVINDPGFGSRLGATVSGLPQTTTRIPVGTGIYSGGGVYSGGGRGGHGNRWNPRGASRTVVVPYGIPVGYYGGYDSGPAPVIVQEAPLVQPAPSVIINQYYSPETANPVMREYSNLPEPIRGPRTEVEQGSVRVNPPSAREQPERRSPPPSEQVVAERTEASRKATITLLSFTDGSVVSAIAYWQQGNELHYVSSNYAKHAVAIGSLDRSATEKLNRDRKVDFQLEAMR